MDKKFYLEAEMKLEKATKELHEAASAVIELPKEGKKQPDLQYFSAIFVSSGENLNHAYFMGSELVGAEGTIVNKALDIEHKEEEIIGHIYDRAFMTKKGEPLDIQELASKEKASLDGMEIHVAIAGIIYKNRFPDLAKEVSDNKWKVSMECYYQDYDIKVGDLILDRNEAEALGLATADESIIGKIAKVVKHGVEVAKGEVARVLRGVCFSGCGIVKNPANPPSVILETASRKGNDEVIVLDYDKYDKSKSKEAKDNNVTSKTIDADDLEISENKEDSFMDEKDCHVGICVSYKKEVHDSTFKGPGTKVLHKDWCALYERGCTSFSRDTTDPDCLRNQVKTMAQASIEEFFRKRAKKDRRKSLADKLVAALNKAAKINEGGN